MSISEDKEALIKRTPVKIDSYTDIDVDKILKEAKTKLKLSNICMGSVVSKVQFIPSGNYAIDFVLSGGIPAGKIIEILGPESSGKTTLALKWVAQIQSKGGLCAIIDAERALAPKYAEKLGVDLSKLVVQEPDYGEQALEALRYFVSLNKFKLIIVDSVAALVPKHELDGEIGDKHVALQARLVAQGLRILTGQLADNKCTVVFLNQLRDKIGVMFGEKTTSPGGRALKHHASVRLMMKRRQLLQDKQKQIVGNKTEIFGKKNKVGNPFRKCIVDIYYTTGIHKYSGLFELAKELNIITNIRGRTYSFEGIEFTEAKFEEAVAGKPKFIEQIFGYK